jgi:tRNA dimethylallyltransferase
MKTEVSAKSPILFVVGPTASGKSGLAMELARRLNGEIICADSQTLRKRLDIGTAKPSLLDQQEINHHLLDVIEPYERFSVAMFKELAEKAIDDIRSKGKLPIIVGGTGLYIDALFYDFNVTADSKNSEYKNELEKMSVLELQKIIVDKNYPMPKNENNPRHLVGVILREGQVNENTKPISGSIIIGLMPEDTELKSRIKDRVDSMFSVGLVKEVVGIINEFGEPPEKLDAIGYPIVARLINNEIDLGTAKELFVQAHWQYARRQKSWFKRNKNIVWFKEVNKAFEYILNEIQ